MDLGRGPVGMRGCSWSVLEQSELRQVEEAVCLKSGLPETGCDDKLEKRWHSEDFYASKMGKIEHFEGREVVERTKG